MRRHDTVSIVNFKRLKFTIDIKSGYFFKFTIDIKSGYFLNFKKYPPMLIELVMKAHT